MHRHVVVEQDEATNNGIFFIEVNRMINILLRLHVRILWPMFPIDSFLSLTQFFLHLTKLKIKRNEKSKRVNLLYPEHIERHWNVLRAF